KLVGRNVSWVRIPRPPRSTADPRRGGVWNRGGIRMGDKTRRVAAIARHGRLRRRNPVGAIFKLLVGTLSVLLISGVAVGAVALSQVQAGIDTVDLVGQEPGAAPVDIGSFEGGFN